MFNLLSEKFSSIFSRLTGKGSLSEQNISEALDKVKDALLEADVPLNVVESFIDEVKQESVGQKVLKSLKPTEQFIKSVHDKLLVFLGGKQEDFSFKIPSIVMVMGLQGSGKTTSLSKFAAYINKKAKAKKKHRKILFASVDYQRPAALEQLKVLADQTGVDYYQSGKTDPVEASGDIVDHFKKHQYEFLFLDTAGRLHVDKNLLEQLKEINDRVRPDYKLLVLDSMTGQESLAVAKAFEQSVGFDRVMLTKMDSDTRGGAAFAFRYALKKPITFLGVGEKPEDLELFRPERVANRILGMGDIVSLVEKAEETIKKDEQERLSKSLMQGKMTLDDFAQQLDMMSKLGSLSNVTKYLPGAATQKLTPEMLEKGEQEMKNFKAILCSMTRKEKIFPELFDASRRKRIAKGAGVQVSDVNNLMRKFEQSQQFAKLFKKFGKFQKFFKR
ncbi:signal recognition particle protein [bacterium]|jgi:signal recognition particle subunit SRP54|nr:signal recognition particle protein [bacterium]